MNHFWVEKFATTIIKNGGKKAIYKKKMQLGYSSKNEVPS
jgi:hypothetical protein